MTEPSAMGQVDSITAVAGEIDISLPAEAQLRNVVLFAACTGLQYLAAPVLYVGVTQAALLNRLGASRSVANLPETAFFVLTAAPVFLAWWLPGAAYLKRSLVVCYVAAALALTLVVAALLLPVPDGVRIAAVIIQGAVTGAAMPTAIALLWEAIGRGVSEKRRGWALSLAFGAGPLLAVAGSLGSQLVLTGRLGPMEISDLAFPWNFALLFGGSVPAMLLAGVLAGGLVVPPDERPALREPLLAGVAGFFSQRVLCIATIVTVLLYVGNTIAANLNLYTGEVLSASPEEFAGYQNALRFAFKVVAGALLGWLLTRSNPRSGILVTGLIFTAAPLWAMFATGPAYLVAFGLFGAGELVGVYAPNYILAASARDQLRRNMAYVTMMMAPAAPAGYLFGLIADRGGKLWGAAVGFQVSFAVCAVIVLAGVVLTQTHLPSSPTTRESAGDE
jgi:MFS family permease